MLRLTASRVFRTVHIENLVRGCTPEGRVNQMLLWQMDGSNTRELKSTDVGGPPPACGCWCDLTRSTSSGRLGRYSRLSKQPRRQTCAGVPCFYEVNGKHAAQSAASVCAHATRSIVCKLDLNIRISLE